MSHRFFKNYTFQQDPDEKIFFKVHKHWLFLFFSFLKALFSLLVLAMVVYFVGFSRIFSSLALLIILSIWLLIVLVYGFFEWAIWYLDLYILTDKRIIDIEQNTLFSRQVSETDLARVQDVTFEIKGILATFFNYGNVKVETAGSETVITLDQIAEPERMQKMIFNQSRGYDIKKQSEGKELFSKKELKGE